MSAEILAQVSRGETVESVHRGHLVVMDGDKNILASAGEPETVTFFRSACKAFQALPLVVSGGADRFGFTEEEIALACASHSGEPVHVAVAASMLAKSGFDESDLKCGTHLPFSDVEARKLLRSGESATPLQNNCSGKHAAMLAFAKYIGADTASYDSVDNPIQQEILRMIARFAELPVDQIAIGIDGCTVPNFAMPLTAMARCFANLTATPASFGEETGQACKRIVSAMIRYPELIGGTERLDTLIMQAASGKVIAKVGAEGVWLGAALPSEKYPKGLALAVKIEDGDDKRGRPVVVVEMLRRLGVLEENDLREISPMMIKNRRREVVGRVDAAFQLLLTTA
jgi:L-asparaginase II